MIQSCKMGNISQGNFVAGERQVVIQGFSLLTLITCQNHLGLDYEQSPIFPQRQQSQRNASARENHSTREKKTRVLPFLAWGEFHAPSRFARPLSLKINGGLLAVYLGSKFVNLEDLSSKITSSKPTVFSLFCFVYIYIFSGDSL